MCTVVSPSDNNLEFSIKIKTTQFEYLIFPATGKTFDILILFR